MNSISVDDEWRLFVCSQSKNMDILSTPHASLPSGGYGVSNSRRDAAAVAEVPKNTPPKKKLVVKTTSPAISAHKSIVEGESVGDAKRSFTKYVKGSGNGNGNKCEDDDISVAENESVSAEDNASVDSDDKYSFNTDDAPLCEDLYISTKTKVLFLNQEIDLQNLFWSIPIEEYWKPVECVVKKQMKIVSKTPEEYSVLVDKLKTIPYYTEHVIKQINNPSARRIKFKDERKITVGVSKKDIMNCRSKVKNAFYNCFAMIMRFKYMGIFREIHVKVFNTGKLEIPGVLNREILDIVSEKILGVLQPYISSPLSYVEDKTDDNVLINSNFNCGFYINRDELFTILRGEKYGLEASYDPCIYPGIKCKYYFNNEAGYDAEKQTGNILPEDRNMKKCELLESKKYSEVSFMIFRTGSCLIVGNCSEKTLKFIFEFIKNILTAEYSNIYVANDDAAVKGKKQKLRKKNVNISSNYYTTIINTNV